MSIKKLFFACGFLAVGVTAMAQDAFKVKDIEIEAGGEATVEVTLTNPNVEYCIFTVDLLLPDGIEVATTTDRRGNVVFTETCQLSDRKEDHTLTVGPVAGGYRFLGKSDTNTPFFGNDGVLFTAKIVAAENVAQGEYTATLVTDGEKNGSKLQVVCDASGNQYFLSDVEFKITVKEATGIKNVGSNGEASAIYNLNGQRVDKVNRGLYIQGGKKIVLK